MIRGSRDMPVDVFLPTFLARRGTKKFCSGQLSARKGLIKGTDMCPCPCLPFPLAQSKIRPHFTSQISTFLHKLIISQLTTMIVTLSTFPTNR